MLWNNNKVWLTNGYRYYTLAKDVYGLLIVYPQHDSRYWQKELRNNLFIAKHRKQYEIYKSCFILNYCTHRFMRNHSYGTANHISGTRSRREPSTCSRCWVLANCYLVVWQQLHQSLVPQVSWVTGSGADAFLIKILKSYMCENMNKHQISRWQFITSLIFCFIELCFNMIEQFAQFCLFISWC